jgi:hypothetical protein
MGSVSGRLRGAWPFIVAAGSVPVATLLAGPCGASCGMCPMGGGCLLFYPVILGVSFLGVFWRRVRDAVF